ncbi:MAG: shikimate dehydrogenase [Pseudohongiellaceae bacterium]|nr:shikimate dehydrogenase [Pseudohongiellaceae bacterium]
MAIDQYAVFGFPIKHSKSPAIHAAFAIQTGDAIEYSAQEVSPERFEQTVTQFFEAGGKGLNITVPFKERAWAMAQNHSPAAKLSGAANTLYLNDQGQLCADNTDGKGMLRDITENLSGQIRDKSVLLLGAGGAVKGVLPSLLAEQPASVCIVNRTLEKAQQLSLEVGGVTSACAYEDLKNASFDWVINGTSAGLSGGVPPIPTSVLKPSSSCYDMVYGSGDTAFQAWAKCHGASKAYDGLGMLVEQAAESFAIWRGVKPSTAEVIASLREQINSNA